jgi:hypothetical protein
MSFTFGGVFSRFFKLIGENFVLFAAIGLALTVAPVIAANYAMQALIGVTQETWASKAYEFTTESWLIGIGLTLGAGVLSLFSMAAMTEIAILRSVGKKSGDRTHPGPCACQYSADFRHQPDRRNTYRALHFSAPASCMPSPHAWLCRPMSDSRASACGAPS